MRRACAFVLSLFALPAFAGQVVVDRIVARIENDVITLSDVRELAAFQRLASRAPAPEPELLRQLIDQWIVRNDAAAARFPRPSQQEVESEFETLRKRVGTPQAFAARLEELGLTEKDVRRLIENQIYLDLFLDRKFRAMSRIQPEDVERYYREVLVPQLQRQKQTVPELDDVRDSITEVLLLQEINRRTDQWIQQTRKRLDIEMVAEGRP
jgi:parvulin-like peptidyl-prolyl isomerase